MSRVLKIAESLRADNIVVQKVNLAKDFDIEDDMIELTNSYHVSVGLDYVSLVKENDDGTFTFIDVSENGLTDKVKSLIEVRYDYDKKLFYREVETEVMGETMTVKRYYDTRKRPAQHVR